MTNKSFKNGASLLLISLCISCNTSKETVTTSANEIDSTRGIVLANMDTTVNPADDFFLFVNGKWVERTEIPAEQGRWGSFNELQEFNNDVLLRVLNSAAENTEKYPEDSDEAKAARFYEVGMDSARAESLGIKPIEPILAQIGAISDTKSLQSTLSELHKQGLDGLFSFFIDQDLKKSDEITAYLYQGGLGMPDRDYYTKEDEKSLKTLQAYKEHITNMFLLSGSDISMAKKAAEDVLKIETELAKASMTKVEQRNVPALYNKMSVAEVKSISPVFDWKLYMNQIGVENIDSIIVAQPEFFKAVDNVVKNTALSDIKTYLKWHVLSELAPYLSHEFVKESFDFNSAQLSGVTEMKPRWKRVMANTNGSVGEALGKLYVAEAFPPEAKKTAQDMVENIRLAFKDRVTNLEWMSEQTKKSALTKLDAFRVKIGYPDKWKEYKDLELKDSYAENILQSNMFKIKRDIEKIGKPIDTTEWGMTPPTVNAYYNPVMNEIVFPAGILQPPFYDYQADAAVNYGGIGAVIGHELTHGFDDQGRQFDAHGNLKDWWTEEDAERFNALTKKLVEQFNGYEALDSLFVNGELTLGENIADLGGLAMAYDGLQRHLEEHGNPGKINGYTPEQRFFMSWAQVWRTKHRPEALRTQILTDTHSPGDFRVNGPLSNLEQFYEAFDVSEGDGMWQPDSIRTKIW